MKPFLLTISSHICIMCFSAIFKLCHFVKSETYVDQGYTPQRLVERHTKEEQFIHLATNRLNQLTLEATLVRQYLNKRNLKGNNGFRQLALQRLSSLFCGLHKIINFEYLEEFKEVYTRGVHQVSTTSAEDKTGSHEMFLNFNGWWHFEEILLLKPSKLANGLNLDTTKGGKLTFSQEAEISMFILSEGKYSLAVEWIEQALFQKYLSESLKAGKCSLDLLTAIYKLTLQEHNKNWQSLNSLDVPTNDDILMVDYFAKPVLPQYLFQTTPLERLTNRRIFHESHKGNGSVGNVTSMYAQLMDGCMGNRHMPLKEQAALYCYFENKQHPYFYINPLYVDQLSSKPPVYQFHKVIGDQLIERLLKIRLENFQSGKFKCGLTDYNYPYCKPGKHTPLTFKLTELITGLKFTMCSRQCNHLEFPPGRTGWEHNDHTGGREKEPEEIEEMSYHGDALASFLYYLQEPEVGGSTAFIPAGTHAPPIKGSALFWWNMYRNGDLRFNQSEHAACPVVHGGKVVLVHFIHYNPNWQTHRCSLDPLE